MNRFSFQHPSYPKNLIKRRIKVILASADIQPLTLLCRQKRQFCFNVYEHSSFGKQTRRMWMLCNNSFSKSKSEKTKVAVISKKQHWICPNKCSRNWPAVALRRVLSQLLCRHPHWIRCNFKKNCEGKNLFERWSLHELAANCVQIGIDHSPTHTHAYKRTHISNLKKKSAENKIDRLVNTTHRQFGRFRHCKQTMLWFSILKFPQICSKSWTAINFYHHVAHKIKISELIKVRSN